MAKSITALFREHPASVDETYWEHFGFAMRASLTLFKAAAGALVHAVFPFLCTTTASDTIIGMHEGMTKRRKHAASAFSTIPFQEDQFRREGEALSLPTFLPSFSRDPEKFARGPVDHANERNGELRRRAFWRVRFAGVIGWTAASACHKTRTGTATLPALPALRRKSPRPGRAIQSVNQAISSGSRLNDLWVNLRPYGTRFAILSLRDKKCFTALPCGERAG